jgi:glycosyltransferase involved in cell wall biosynthesis
VARIAVVSFRLGLNDGVSIEAAKWMDAFAKLGHSSFTVAGEGNADFILPGLAIDAFVDPDLSELERTLMDADVVVVENMASLPLNLDARDAIYEVLKDRVAIFRHHDLASQRAHLRHIEGPRNLGPWAHVTINDLSRIELKKNGIDATTIYNHFDCNPPVGRRDLMRHSIHVTPSARVALQPTRALSRKNIPGALRLCESLGAVYWLLGNAEDGYQGELEMVLKTAMTGVRRGLAQGGTIHDAYAACDFVVMPSTWEGFGNPVIESVTHRRPLARFRYPVCAEIEAHGFTFFDLDDVDGIAAAIEDPDSEALDKNLAIARANFDLSLLPGRLVPVLASVGIL